MRVSIFVRLRGRSDRKWKTRIRSLRIDLLLWVQGFQIISLPTCSVCEIWCYLRLYRSFSTPQQCLKGSPYIVFILTSGM